VTIRLFHDRPDQVVDSTDALEEASVFRRALAL
jgi:hypothetical protein